MEDLKNVNLTNIKECPDCASVNILFSQAREQVICRECGLIFEPFVAEEPLVKPRSAVSSQRAKKSAVKSKPASKSKPAKKAAAKKPAKSSKKKRR